MFLIMPWFKKQTNGSILLNIQKNLPGICIHQCHTVLIQIRATFCKPWSGSNLFVDVN